MYSHHTWKHGCLDLLSYRGRFRLIGFGAVERRRIFALASIRQCKGKQRRESMNPLSFLLVFLKASLFSTSALGNIPSLHHDLLTNGWASDTEFGEALSIGQISPGSNGLWVISIGYLTYGWLGTLLALVS